MSSNHDDIVQCVGYFRSRPCFERLLSGIRDKYISLSYFGGNVKLTSLTSEEKDALEGFFQKAFYKNRTVTISVEQFQKALTDSKDTNKIFDSSSAGWLTLLREPAVFG